MYNKGYINDVKDLFNLRCFHITDNDIEEVDFYLQLSKQTLLPFCGKTSINELDFKTMIILALMAQYD